MKKELYFIAIAVVIISCGSSTRITGSWKSASAQKNYNNILVAALTSHAVSQSTVESDIAQALRKRGVNVTKGIDVMPPNLSSTNTDKEKLLGSVRTNGTDAILTVSLIDEETETRYVPGTYTYNPGTRFRHYESFWGYYSYWYPHVYQPGYYVQDKIYFMETNLYDAGTEELLWSAQSQTYNPVNLDRFSEDFAEQIAKKLEEDGIINKTDISAKQ